MTVWRVLSSPAQKMLTDVWTKFRLFQKPANFDSRLAECERVLNGVKSQAGLLEIGSVEHDVVQSQLEQCMVGNHISAWGGWGYRMDGWVPCLAPCCVFVSSRNCTRC